MNKTAIASIILATALCAACGKSEDKSAGGTAAKPAAEATPTAAAKPAATEYKDIAWMGLKAEVRTDAEIMDSSADAPNAMISNGDCTVMISTVTEAYGTFETAVSDADKGMGNKAEKWLKKEQTADGFHLEFEGKSLMGDPIWEVTIRRKVGDKTVECGRAGEQAEVACVAQVCASLQAI